MINLDDLIHGSWPQQFWRGQWVLVRPIEGPFLLRVRDAWAVLRGRAEAVRFHDV